MDAWSVGQPQPASAIVGASISDLREVPVKRRRRTNTGKTMGAQDVRALFLDLKVKARTSHIGPQTKSQPVRKQGMHAVQKYSFVFLESCVWKSSRIQLDGSYCRQRLRRRPPWTAKWAQR
jgi:hypothetical protein